MLNRFVFLFLLCTLLSCTGNHKKPNLNNTAHGDTAQINTLNNAAFKLWSSDPDSLLSMGERTLALSEQMAYSKGQLDAHFNMGVGYYEVGAHTQSISHYKEAIVLAHSIPDSIYESRIRSNVALPLIALGKYDEALENIFSALIIGEDLQSPRLVAHAHCNLGIAYHYQHKYDQALHYYQLSLSAYEEIGDSMAITFLIGNMAHIYLVKKDYKKAEKYYITSLRSAQKLKNAKAIGNALISLGNVYLEQKKQDKALDYFFQAEEVLAKTGEKTEYLRLLQNLSTCFSALHKKEGALKFALEGFQLAQQQQNLHYTQTFSEILSDLYTHTGDYQSALSYHKILKNTSDSLHKKDSKEQIVRLEEKYKYEKSKNQIEASYTQQLDRKQNYLYIWAISALSLIVVVILLIRNVKQKKMVNTLLKQANQQMASQHDLLKKEAAFKNHLLSLVAHDIRSPIASLRMALDLVNSDYLLPEKKKQLINTSHEEIVSLATFVDNLLLWVMRQTDKKEVKKTCLDINKITKEILALYKAPANNKNITIDLQVHEKANVYADKESLKIVMRNLVDNAIKHSRSGDHITIRTHIDEGSDKVKIMVRDTGEGVNEAIKKSLLSTDLSTTNLPNTKNAGSGLGLMLCQQYLSINNSKLHVESEPNRGSTFWFLLPDCRTDV